MKCFAQINMLPCIDTQHKAATNSFIQVIDILEQENLKTSPFRQNKQRDIPLQAYSLQTT